MKSLWRKQKGFLMASALCLFYLSTLPAPSNISATSSTLASTTILINEVLVNAAGSETGANEWVELKNISMTSQTLSNWSVRDNSTDCENFPSVTIPSGGFLIIAGDRTKFLMDNPSFTGAVIGLDGAIGNGLANGGDRVDLFDAANCGGTKIDCVSWGSDTTCFSPSVASQEGTANDGKSIARASDTDTDAASDWLTQQTPTPMGFSPTAVILTSFSARSAKTRILIRWETVSEFDVVGYNLLRSTSPDGPYAQINPTLMPAQGSGSLTGTSYRYTDPDVSSGTTYYYLLEVVSLDGSSVRYGPISVQFSGLERLKPRQN